MALVMVLSLAPVALAEGKTVEISGDTTVEYGTNAKITLTATPTGFSETDNEYTYKWETASGNINVSGTTNSCEVTCTATNPTSDVSGSVKCTVSTGTDPNVTTTVTVKFTVAQQQNPVATTLELGDPSPNKLTAGNTTTKSTVTATVKDADNQPMSGATVTVTPKTGSSFTATGTAAVVNGTTNESGQTTITITAGNTAGTAAFDVSAGAGNTDALKDTITVTVNPAVATVSITAPNELGVGENFTATAAEPTGITYATVDWSASPSGKVEITQNRNYPYQAEVKGIAAANSVTITATFKNSSGTKVAEGSKTIKVTQADLSITTDAKNDTLTSYGASCTATATGSVTNSANYYVWSTSKASVVDVSTGHSATATLTGYSTGTATITVRAYASSSSTTVLGEAKITVEVKYDYDVNPAITVSEDSSGYNMADRDDKGDSSVIDQIESLLRNSLGSYPYVVFTGVKDTAGYLTAETRTNYYLDRMPSSASSRYNGLLSDVDFIPSKDGTATFEFTVYLDDNKDSSRSGLLTVKVEDGVSASGDITYTASLGEEVSFDPNDFDIFWTDTYSKGTLDHVVFGSVSGGTLKDASGNVRTSDKYYLNPGRNDDDLAEVYFTPSSSTSKKATTIKVPFTAYGSRTGSTGSGYDLEGTISIVYLNDSASDISYSTTNGSVTLNPQDFIDAYKEATGKTASSSTNLTIEFQNVPSIGTLTYTNGSRKTTLTSKNVKNNRYTTKSSGTYRLEQLTYTGTSGKDTIDYIAYSGGTAQFSGKVVFNGTAAIPTNLSIPMSCTSSYGVNMNSGSFTSANATAMAKCSIIRFDRPTGGGSLTYAGTSAVGVSIPFSLVGMVTYTPASGFNGTDRILFVAQDASGNTVASGQVNVTVSGNSGSGNNNTGSGTPISKMTDVPATAWYRTELSDLMNKGIISGRTPTSFAPDGTVTYGEALKMVLRAAGYPAQSEPTGNNWAINYKNLAVSNGIIEDSIDLNANITRDKMVEVAAKALKINASTASSPFTDSSNPYAIALYNTYYSGSKGIIGGNPDGTFKGGDTLNRAEMCAIVWRMNTYYAIRYSSVMPDGI